MNTKSSKTALELAPVDVRSTRNHCYPKYILFPSTNHPTLLRTQADRREVFDFAIETGVAVIIPTKLNGVCDAMNWISGHLPDYRSLFYDLLAVSSQDTSGWIKFLEIVAKRTATFYIRSHGGPQERADLAFSVWRKWYVRERQYLECQAGNFGSEFVECIREAEEFVRALMHLLSH